MKNLHIALSSILAAIVLLAGQVQSAQTTKEISPHAMGERSIFSDRATTERIAPSARVCVKGEECEKETAAAAEAPAASGPRSGSDVYNAACMGCHAAGNAMSAPASKADWDSRSAAKGGLDGLLKSAKAGVGMMPPMGMCMDCSDEELSAAIKHMLDM